MEREKMTPNTTNHEDDKPFSSKFDVRVKHYEKENEQYGMADLTISMHYEVWMETYKPFLRRFVREIGPLLIKEHERDKAEGKK